MGPRGRRHGASRPRASSRASATAASLCARVRQRRHLKSTTSVRRSSALPDACSPISSTIRCWPSSVFPRPDGRDRGQQELRRLISRQLGIPRLSRHLHRQQHTGQGIQGFSSTSCTLRVPAALSRQAVYRSLTASTAKWSMRSPPAIANTRRRRFSATSSAQKCGSAPRSARPNHGRSHCRPRQPREIYGHQSACTTQSPYS